MQSGGLSGKSGPNHQQRLQRHIFKEADFETNGHHLSQFSSGGEIFAAGAEVGERKVACAGQLKARGHDGAVEIDDGTKLYFETDLHRGRRECPATKYLSSAVSQRRGQIREQSVTLFVTEALYIEKLHRIL